VSGRNGSYFSNGIFFGCTGWGGIGRTSPWVVVRVGRIGPGKRKKLPARRHRSFGERRYVALAYMRRRSPVVAGILRSIGTKARGVKSSSQLPLGSTAHPCHDSVAGTLGWVRVG
jgi:hypothetical protein